MLLSHCPNCQHDNQPGERFCASCGVPLDLKPCPVCGKVDEIKATICTGCGAHFPPIVAGRYSDDIGVGPNTVPGKTIPPLVSPPSSTIGPLPLIVVALAAAGIPMLWLYRNEMPVPKAWRPQPAIEAPAFPPPPIAAPATMTEVPPTTPAPAPKETASPKPMPQPLSITPPAAEKTPPASAAEPPAAIAPSEPASPAPKANAPEPVAQPVAPPVAKPTIRSNFPARKPPPAAAPPNGECTAALAAVGLCEPKPTR